MIFFDWITENLNATTGTAHHSCVRHIQNLMDFIKATGSCEVKLELKDAQSAGQLRPAEGEDYKYRYIVMPMRI